MVGERRITLQARRRAGAPVGFLPLRSATAPAAALPTIQSALPAEPLNRTGTNLAPLAATSRPRAASAPQGGPDLGVLATSAGLVLEGVGDLITGFESRSTASEVTRSAGFQASQLQAEARERGRAIGISAQRLAGEQTASASAGGVNVEGSSIQDVIDEDRAEAVRERELLIRNADATALNMRRQARRRFRRQRRRGTAQIITGGAKAAAGIALGLITGL